MKYSVKVHIMPRAAILDPQGKATESGLHQLGFTQIQNVRIGRQIEFGIQAPDRKTAEEIAEGACRKLLANLIMETYTFEVLEAD